MVLVTSRPDSIQSAIVGSARDERSDRVFTTTADIRTHQDTRTYWRHGSALWAVKIFLHTATDNLLLND